MRFARKRWRRRVNYSLLTTDLANANTVGALAVPGAVVDAGAVPEVQVPAQAQERRRRLHQALHLLQSIFQFYKLLES